jgi:hypothetical protein
VGVGAEEVALAETMRPSPLVIWAKNAVKGKQSGEGRGGVGDRKPRRGKRVAKVVVIWVKKAVKGGQSGEGRGNVGKESREGEVKKAITYPRAEVECRGSESETRSSSASLESQSLPKSVMEMVSPLERGPPPSARIIVGDGLET